MPRTPTKSKTGRGRPAPARPPGSSHLLVVSPDPDVQARLADELAPAGYTLHRVPSAAEALRRARYIYYPVVLLSLGEPPADQPIDEMIAALHSASPESEIVVLADARVLEAHRAGHMPGVVSYLQVPYSGEQLRLATAQGAERQRLRRRLAALSEVAYAVGQLMDLPRVLEVGLDKTLEVIGRGMGLIYLVDEGASRLVLQAARGLPPDFPAGARDLPVAGDVHEKVLTGMQPAYLEDLSVAPSAGFAGLLRREGARSAAIVPLRMRDQAFGTLTVASSGLQAFSSDDLRLLVSIGQHLGVAAAHAQLHERERTAREQLTELLLAVQQQAEELRNLSGRVVRAQEAERQHIARELHDGIGQVLTALRIDLGLVADMLPSDPATAGARLAETREHLGQLMNDVRRMSAELRPSMLDDLGLLPTLNWLADGFARRLDIPVIVEAHNWPEHVNPDVEIAVFRLVQEALNNAVKHADARHIHIELGMHEGTVLLDVTDDGRGFDVDAVLRAPAEAHGSGLRGMRERVVQLGGDIRIAAEPGHGTHIHVQLPLRPGWAEPRRGGPSTDAARAGEVRTDGARSMGPRGVQKGDGA
jgi:signal transduction histidine kinase/ActR/RegA family two-component response regulator